MARLNARKVKVEQPQAITHKNFMDGVSYDINDPILKLRVAAASCFFGEPSYYGSPRRGKVDGFATSARDPYFRTGDASHLRSTLGDLGDSDWTSMTVVQVLERAIDDALNFNAEKTLQAAAELRNDGNIRTTPQVILVRAAHNKNVRGTELIRKYAGQIVKRTDEPSVGLAYHFAKYGKDAPIPNSLKRAWADYLNRQNDYSLSKYRAEGNDVKLVDVVNLVHARGPSIHKLIKGELKTTDATWEAIISAEGSTKASWTKSVEVMGHMALLRNLRNFQQAGVEPNAYLDKLKETAEDGKQLPFRYWSAYQAVKSEGVSPRILDAIEECLDSSVGRLPKFHGKMMSLVDNSGSAQSATTSTLGTVKVSTIGNLTGVLAGMRADEGYLGVFGDKLDVIPLRSKSSVFDQLEKAEKSAKTIGQGTEAGVWLFWDKAIREKEHWDHVFVFSDMQAGHGGLYGNRPRDYADYAWASSPTHIDVSKLIKAYRSKVNPLVQIYLVQIAGYQDTLMPEFYPRTYILGGWGEGVLKFAGEMAKLIK